MQECTEEAERHAQLEANKTSKPFAAERGALAEADLRQSPQHSHRARGRAAELICGPMTMASTAAAAPPPQLLYGRWALQTSRSTGARYFFDAASGASLWHDPALPAGWGWRRAAADAPREFVNLRDGRAQLEQPTAPLPELPPAAVPVPAPAPAPAPTAAAAQLSFQASRAAADDLGSRAFVPDAATRGANVPAEVASKRDYLFGALLPADRLWAVQGDEV